MKLFCKRSTLTLMHLSVYLFSTYITVNFHYSYLQISEEGRWNIKMIFFKQIVQLVGISSGRLQSRRLRATLFALA
ncbi:hypothetical protein FGO68_gene13278 [Halteria grandinella]|uniref:Uncharacterized protein n=1 Tax=Halteria grandinella TaxID=5974 RepID=A0A8J8T9X3_HALGN|nr:hypothetical protein FGO68_gene13278 [Halteria grandinella]